MNQQERKYAIERVTSITNAKIKSITDTYTIPAVRFTTEEKVAKIQKGEYTLSANPSRYGLDGAFDFGEKGAYLSDEGKELQQKVFNASSKLKDEIMLGDSKVALELIRGFEND